MPKFSELIPDAGLRLAILEGMGEDFGGIDLTPAIEVAAQKAEVQGWIVDENDVRVLDDDVVQEDIFEPCVRAIGDIEIQTSDLYRVTQLNFDGGNEIYMWLTEALAKRLNIGFDELDLGGETDTFDVESLEGIAHCIHLVELDCDAYGFKVDKLFPLKGLTELAALSLRRIPKDPEVLLELSALEELQLPQFDHPVLQQLDQHGVDISFT